MNFSRKRIGLSSVFGIAVFYTASICLGDALSVQAGTAKSYTAPFAVLFSAAIVICLYTGGYEAKRYALPNSAMGSKQIWCAIPFCLFALTGLCGGSDSRFSVPEMIFCFVSACCTAFAEEMLFRGLLLRTLSECCQNPKAAIFISGATFGIWEIIGLLSGRDFILTMLLLVCDIAIGAALSAFALRTHNLMPCVLCHAARNVLCTFGAASSLMLRMCGSAAVIIIAIFFTCRTFRSLNEF